MQAAAAPLNELRQGLGLHVKTFTQNTVGGVKQNFGGVEHFIRGVREILGGGGLTPPVNPPMLHISFSCPACMAFLGSRLDGHYYNFRLLKYKKERYNSHKLNFTHSLQNTISFLP